MRRLSVIAVLTIVFLATITLPQTKAEPFLSPAQEPTPTPKPPSPAGVSYEAVQFTGFKPPDPSIAVGPTDVVVVTNNIIRFYDKSNSGNMLSQSTLNDWYSTVPATVFFDPKVIYDQWNAHFIIVAMGRNDNTNQSWWLVSTSPGPNTTGTWCKYKFDATLNNGTQTTNWADFPGIGVDGTALYLTANMYTFPASSPAFQYAKIRIINLANVEACSNVQSWTDYWGLRNTDGSMALTIQPAHRYEFQAPEMFLVNASYSGNSITYWRISNPLTTPSLYGPANISVDAFSAPPNAQQPNNAPRLATQGSIELFQAQYRYGGIWTPQVIAYNTVNGTRAAIRIYEINGGGTSYNNELTIWSPDFDLFNPSLTTDNSDDVIISFSLSGAVSYPSIVYMGRLVSDPPNTLENVISTLKASTVSYNDGGNPSHWGDYSGTAIDSDGYTVWIFNEFAKTNSTWSTWIGTVAYQFSVYLPVILNNH